MPKIDVDRAPAFKGSRYPEPFDEPCKGRQGLRLGIAAGLSQFGVNLVTLKPGSWASQRHWHEKEDEFVYVLSGELVLVEDEGEVLLRPGDCAGWKAACTTGTISSTRARAKLLFWSSARAMTRTGASIRTLTCGSIRRATTHRRSTRRLHTQGWHALLRIGEELKPGCTSAQPSRPAVRSPRGYDRSKSAAR